MYLRNQSNFVNISGLMHSLNVQFYVLYQLIVE